MSTAGGFGLLCKELSQLQVSMLQRASNPGEVACKALTQLQHHQAAIAATKENVVHVPLFLRSCVTLLERAPTSESSIVLDRLNDIHLVAEQYVGERCGDANEAASVLRSVIGLDQLQRRLLKAKDGNIQIPSRSGSSSPNNKGTHHVVSSSVERKTGKEFAGLLRPSYQHAYHQWAQQKTKMHTLSMLALLRGTAMVHASDFRFPPLNPDQRGLLPMKSRVQMEAKMQRCPGARELLTAMKNMEVNRLDAGMCITLLADLGFYDTDLCNLACEVLHSAHAVVTSQQFAQVIYSLGVLQHRHVYQRFFSSLITAKQCNADGIRQHLLGLAMLQQPPHSERHLMDGVFLHALRAGRSSGSSSSSSSPVFRRNRKQADSSRHSSGGSSSSASVESQYALPFTWYVDIGYGLSCLDISHHKFKLMMARQVRGAIPRMSTSERCKVLYALGNPNDPTVPQDLLPSWENKIGKALSFAYLKLQDIDLSDGPQVMHALRFCGVSAHPRLPQEPKTLEEGRKENPAEVLLRTWATTPKENIMHLVEQIDSTNLYTGESGVRPTEQLAKILATLAKACPSPPSAREQYRFASLCATIERHVGQLSLDELIIVLNGTKQLGLAQHYPETVQQLLNAMWDKRDEMTDSKRLICEDLMRDLGDGERASQLHR